MGLGSLFNGISTFVAILMSAFIDDSFSINEIVYILI